MLTYSKERIHIYIYIYFAVCGPCGMQLNKLISNGRKENTSSCILIANRDVTLRYRDVQTRQTEDGEVCRIQIGRENKTGVDSMTPVACTPRRIRVQLFACVSSFGDEEMANPGLKGDTDRSGQGLPESVELFPVQRH